MFCKYCGKEVSNDSVFCKYCGKKLDETKKTKMIDIKVNVERLPGINTISIPEDISLLNLKMLIASKCSGDVDGMKSKLYLDRTDEEVSEHYAYLSELELKEDDIFIFVPRYIERTVIRRGGFSDMRCLYGCPMSRESLYEAENYSLDDSVVE